MLLIVGCRLSVHGLRSVSYINNLLISQGHWFKV